MNRIAHALLLLAAGCGWLCLPAAGQAPNLAANPGLEVDADNDGVPDHWSVPKPQDYPADWHVGGGAARCGTADLAKSGQHSILYAVPGADPPAVPPDRQWDADAWAKATATTAGEWAVAFKTDDFPVKEYNLYQVRCWVKADNVLSLHVKFIATYVYPGQAKPVVRWIHPLLHDPGQRTMRSGNWDWELWEATVAVPEYVEKGRIEFWVREWGAPAKLYCDDMSVTEAGPYPILMRNRKQ